MSPCLNLAAIQPTQAGLLCSAQGDPELRLRRELLRFLPEHLIELKLERIHAQSTILFKFLREDLLHQCVDLLRSLTLRCSNANNELLHINQASFWINRRSISSSLQQANCFLNIGGVDVLSQLHLGHRL